MESQMQYTQQAALLKALSSPVRLEIVHTLLREGRRNVGRMEQGLGMSQSCISQHLQRLRSAQIVRAERVGNEVFYRVSSPEAARLTAVLFGESAEEYAI